MYNRADVASDRGEAIASWGLYASLDDMIAFDSALRNGKLISPNDLALMWSNGRLANGALSPAGLAFDSVTYARGHRAASKSGQAGVNYTTFPDDGLSVILLTNMEQSDWGNWYDAREIARLYDIDIQPISTLTPQRDRSGADEQNFPGPAGRGEWCIAVAAANTGVECGRDAGNPRIHETPPSFDPANEVSRL